MQVIDNHRNSTLRPWVRSPDENCQGFLIMWQVYVLKSLKDGALYVGMSKDISRRLDEHNSGKSKFTSGHMPWEIIYKEAFLTSAEARSREKYFKSAAGKKFIKNKISAGSLPE